MEPNIGIAKNDRKKLCQMLNELLADEFVLYTQTRGCHWNITGPHFSELHKFFDEQYQALNEIVDEVAERIRTLGETANASLTVYLKQTRLKEKSTENQTMKTLIADLVAAHETIIRILRKDLKTADEKYGDMGTSDFLTGLMEKHEKMTWMLRSFIG